jgi:RNA polymerase sigma-70 factor (ECF subfamily)
MDLRGDPPTEPSPSGPFRALSVRTLMVDRLTGRERVERVYRQEGPRMVRALFAYTRSLDVAEDAVAEAFAQAIRRGDAIDDVAAWAWRSSFRLADRELAARRRAGAGEAVPERAYEMSEAAVDVLDALGRLSPKQRAAVLLHHYVDMPVRDVASLIGSSSAAVRVHLSAGRRRLRQLLENHGD